MRATVVIGSTVIALALGGVVVARHAGHGAASPSQSDETKIKNAMSAAPAAIAQNATIMDWPAKEGEPPRQLRAGTNGWVCYPSTPPAVQGASGEDPMCLDKAWQDWAEAWTSKRTPKLSGVGIGYMLQGDRGASNIDPYATKQTPDNEWVQTGPHIMVLVADVKQLEGFSHDPKTGGPYVMWRGTPYAHIMVPLK